jgi:hypothetical protein
MAYTFGFLDHFTDGNIFAPLGSLGRFFEGKYNLEKITENGKMKREI